MQRDLAGRILCHYLESSFGHNDEENAVSGTSGAFSMQAILERIYNLCQNFSPYKRLGAVFIMNSIYPVLMLVYCLFA